MPKTVWIIGMIIAFIGLVVFRLSVDEQNRRAQWESTVSPCLFDPRTGEPGFLPCKSDGKILVAP